MAAPSIDESIDETIGSVSEEPEIVRAARLIPDFSRTFCPGCNSENLLIKAPKRMERLMILLTRKRKYRCKDCGTGFRMPDRRRISRDHDAAEALSRAIPSR